MLLSDLKRFFEGRVYFTAREGFPDLFMNSCMGQRARLRDVFIKGDSVDACVRYSEYKRVLRAADLSGMAVESTKKTGLPAVVSRNKKRLGFPAGIVLAAVIIQILSGVLWSVDISGLEHIKEDDMYAFLEDRGVRKGTFLSAIDCNEIELMTENMSPLIMKATANLIGSKLYIEVIERTPPPDMADESVYADVVAAKDGVVLSADILAGVSNVKEGDEVKKGDVLASGRQELSDGSTRLLRARAIVLARTEASFSCGTALSVNVKRPVKQKDSRSLYFFGLVFPKKAENAACAAFLSTPSSVFPIGVIRTRTSEFEDVKLKLPPARAKLICLTDLAHTVFRSLGDTYVSGREISSTRDARQYVIDARFFCEEDIAKEQLFRASEVSP
ncbi:MAG: sporulation protein YqfD [Clostridia bacterium]|nr:sporulation protein YqfD [Clostridia bacterium]